MHNSGLFWRQYNIHEFLRITQPKIVTLVWRRERVKLSVVRLEWLYCVQCDKFIALCSAMSGLPSGRKIVSTVVALLSAIFYGTLFSNPTTPPPAAVLRSPCPPPLFGPFATAAPETSLENSVIVLPL